MALALALAGCGTNPIVMPSVLGSTLDVALSDIEKAGISVEAEVVGGGMFGVVNESNWQVCDQSPAAGQAVTGTPRLIVDRSCETGVEASQSPTPTPSETTPTPSASAQSSASGQASASGQSSAASSGSKVKTSATAAAALATLDGLRVKGRAPKTGYSRVQFGQAWADVNRNGCDTRNDILRRDLTQETVKPGGCVVLRGTLQDPYTGAVMSFKRGSGTSSLIQIDHAVALGDSWQKGAQSWTDAKRRAFANDPLNLRAVNGRANMQKGMSDAASWLPSNKSHRCSYVATQIAVKGKYGLWVTAAEKAAMQRILSTCAEPTVLPAGGLDLAALDLGGPNSFKSGGAASSGGSTGSSGSAGSASSGGKDDPMFSSCTKAVAAGFGPYRQGVDPEYDWYDDRDNDGTVCE